MTKRKRPGNRVRERHVWERDNGRCKYCGSGADVVDYIEPRAFRGDSSIGNMVLACAECRRIGGELYFGSFLDKRDWILECRRTGVRR